MDTADGSRVLLRGRGAGAPTAGTASPRRAPAWPILLGAALVAVIAVGSTAQRSVPLVSGIAVALLVPAAVVDVRERRLPDPIVACAGVALAGGIAAALLVGDDVAVGSAFVGTIAFAGPLLALHLVSPGAMGFGDVKSGVVIGFALGLVHWQLALAALALATGLTAAYGLLARLRIVAFGPGLVAAAAIALAAAPLFAPLDDAPAPAGDRPTGVHP